MKETDVLLLRKHLRCGLNSLVEMTMAKIPVLSEFKLTSADEKMVDTSILTGSTGVLFGLYKYSLLLREETGCAGPNWLDETLSAAIYKGLL